MKYLQPDGSIYCRYARTPPVANSAMAAQCGLRALLWAKSQYGFHVEAGRSVKMRVVFGDRTGRLTCHAMIDWVEVDAATSRYEVGLSQLSLTDGEFELLLSKCADHSAADAIFAESVRRAATPDAPVAGSGEAVRHKAVTMSVALIEEIDERRGDTPFSRFIEDAVRAYLAERS